ncbi:tRNA adenosine deaminase-associated protein [uncultured Aeromicrobium sp.]|uniref:tRNA adenosine deaminase-associated protein n=1 Tax=uncultured Aeromicrobium sp. TaxID=337820 RepID=UPI0025E2589C|nr:tRNA adenosine deaminase-associated protein [uncultured Aeromicrobium sp.]
MAEDDVDFVVAAYRDDGEWAVMELPPRLGEDFAALSESLRRFPSDVGVLGMVSVKDDFFVIVRRSGDQVRVMLSDNTAALDYPLAADVAEVLDAPDPEDDDTIEPVGDLDILSDLGVASVELFLLCEDDDLYPDEVLLDIAQRLGFREQMETIVG